MKLVALLFSLCLIFLIKLSACASAEPTYTRISGEQAHMMMQDLDNFILLDVRTYEEFRRSRIEGAVLIPHNEIFSRADNELPDRNVLILIYCRSGSRSEIAANELIAMGFTNVYDFGGIETDWPFETVSAVNVKK